MVSFFKFTLLFTIFIIANSSFALNKVPIGIHSVKDPKKVNLIKQKQDELDEVRKSLKYIQRGPYIPQKIEYGFSMGSSWRERSHYLFGANLGFNTGRCKPFSYSQYCQNFLDLLLDLTGKDGDTILNAHASLRWQFIRFPSSYSPFIRVLIGMSNLNLPSGVSQHLSYGIGAGVTTFLHPRADIRIESRVGYNEKVHGAAMISVQFKMDRWLEYFVDKLNFLPE